LCLAGYFGETADLDPTQNENWHYAGILRKAGFITNISRGAEPVIIADSDHDGNVNMNDLNNFESNWLEVDCPNKNWCDWTDFDGNTKVDFAILAENWLEGI
jgi:hypothetical protein